MTQKPEKKIKVGAVSASVWKRTVEKDGRSFVVRQVTLDRSYKDRNGEWKSVNSYDTNDIPKAVMALVNAYKHILDAPDDKVVVEDVV